MKYLTKMIAMIKGYRLIKYQVIEGSIKSGKFKLLSEFDGIIEKGKSMTTKQLENTVNNLSNTVNNLSNTVNGLVNTVNELAITMIKRFDSIEKRLDNVESTLEEHTIIFKRNNLK